MVDPSEMFTKVPSGDFVNQIGDLEVGSVVDHNGSLVMVGYLQKCADGNLLAYYDYVGTDPMKSIGSGCASIHPNGRFKL